MKLAVRLALLGLALAPVVGLWRQQPRNCHGHARHRQTARSSPSLRASASRWSRSAIRVRHPRSRSTCAVGGAGRWVDPQTFVYDFATPLPGGTACSFQMRDGLKSVAGYAVSGQQEFKVNAGGPVARAVLPGQYDGEIEEDQVFLVAANMPASPASVAANAYCAVDGVGEKIPVDVLAADLPGKLLGEMGTDNWNVRSFLQNAGLPATIPASAEDRAKGLASVLAVKCHRPLPAGRDMALVWGAKIAGAGGKQAGADQRFDYTVRKPFTARFECSRVNAQAGCSPVEKAYVRFTAPIAMSAAQKSASPPLTARRSRRFSTPMKRRRRRSATSASPRLCHPRPPRS